MKIATLYHEQIKVEGLKHSTGVLMSTHDRIVEILATQFGVSVRYRVHRDSEATKTTVIPYTMVRAFTLAEEPQPARRQRREPSSTETDG